MKDRERKIRIKAADYVWCKADECLVPRNKLNPSDSIFDDEDEGPTCPFCGGTDLEDVATKRAGADADRDADKSERKDKPEKNDKGDGNSDKDKLTFA